MQVCRIGPSHCVTGVSLDPCGRCGAGGTLRRPGPDRSSPRTSSDARGRSIQLASHLPRQPARTCATIPAATVLGNEPSAAGISSCPWCRARDTQCSLLISRCGSIAGSSCSARSRCRCRQCPGTRSGRHLHQRQPVCGWIVMCRLRRRTRFHGTKGKALARSCLNLRSRPARICTRRGNWPG